MKHLCRWSYHRPKGMVAKRSQLEDALAECAPLAWVARPLEFAAGSFAARVGTFATSVRASRAGCL